MPTFNVKVLVEYEYEVEADDADAATQEGYNFEQYEDSSSIYSIDVEEVSQA